MKDVAKSVGETCTMLPRNPIAVDFINKSAANFKEALRKGKDYRENPQFSLQEDAEAGNILVFMESSAIGDAPIAMKHIISKAFIKISHPAKKILGRFFYLKKGEN